MRRKFSVRNSRPIKLHINNNEVLDISLLSKDSVKQCLKMAELILSERPGMGAVELDERKYTLKNANGTLVNLDGSVKTLLNFEFWLHPPFLGKKSMHGNRNQIFGVNIETALKKSSDYGYPVVLVKAIDFLSKERSLRTVGVFRLTGNRETVERYKKLFNENPLDTEFPSNMDPHTVALLVKEYISDLPEPLIHETVQKTLLRAAEIGDEQLRARALKQAMLQLYDINYHVLRLLFQYLVRLCMYSSKNFVTPTNMSIVWGPILFPGPKTAAQPKKSSVGSASPRKRSIKAADTPLVTTKLTSEQKKKFVNIIATAIDNFANVFGSTERNRTAGTTTNATKNSAEKADTDSLSATRRTEKLGKLVKRNDRADKEDGIEFDDEDDYDSEDAYVEDETTQSSSPPRTQDPPARRKQSMRSFVNSMKTPPSPSPATAKPLAPTSRREKDLSLDLSTLKSSLTVGSKESPIGTLATERAKPTTVKGISSGFLTSRPSTKNESHDRRTMLDNDPKPLMQFVEHWKAKYHTEVEARKQDQEEFQKSEKKWRQKEVVLQRQIDELKSNVEHARLTTTNKEQEFLLTKETMQLQYETLKREMENMTLRADKETKELKRQHLLALKHYGIEDSTTMVDPSQRKLSPQFFHNLHKKKQKVHHAPSPQSVSDDFAVKDASPPSTPQDAQPSLASASSPSEEQVTETTGDISTTDVSTPFDPETTCFKCRKPIGTEWVEAEEKRFHYDCFLCNTCGKPISGAFKDHQNGEFTCKGCLQPAGTVKIKASNPSKKQPSICAACDGKIKPGDRVRALGKAYHRDCFRCMSCGSEFANMKFFAANDNPVCADCKRPAKQ